MRPLPLPTSTPVDTNDPHFIETVAVLLTGTAAAISTNVLASQATETADAYFIETVSAYLTGTAAALATSTPTPYPTATQTNTPQSALVGRIYFEDFLNDQSGWNGDDDEISKFYFSDGLFFVEITNTDADYFMAPTRYFDDGVITVEMTHLSGDDTLTSGTVIWRFQDIDNYYLLEVKDNGSFCIYRFIDGTSEMIKLPTTTPALNPTGSMNKITIASYQNNFDIYINEQFVYHFTDSSLPRGSIGLGAHPDLSSGVKVAFDNLSVYNYDPENGNTPALPELTPTPSYRAATWAEISQFLANDPTNWNTYNLDTYNCIDFAIDLVENAHLYGIKANIIAVDFVGQEDGHAFVEFETADAGLIYVEPQGDVTYSNVSIGANLCDTYGEAECMGIIEAIHHMSECNHQHLCSAFPQ